MVKHLLVDLENIQPTASAVAHWMGADGKAWIFYGPHQHRLLPSFQALGAGVTLVPISRPGANSLDFHLVFYLGYLAAGNPTADFTVLAKDTGYDPAIAHARLLTFTVKRISALGVTPAKRGTIIVAKTKSGGPATKTAANRTAAKKSIGKSLPTAKTPAPIPKPHTTKRPTPVKKPVKTSGITLSASTGKPTGKLVQKPRKVEVASVLSAKDAVQATKAPAPKSASTKPVIAIYRDVLADLHGPNRPRNMASLERRIQSRIGSEPVPTKVQAVIDHLKTTDTIRMIAGKLVYFPDEPPAASSIGRVLLTKNNPRAEERP